MERMNNATMRDCFAPVVSHKGTFNGSPLVAAAACAAIPLLATGDVQAQADAMADRMRAGMNAALLDAQLTGFAYRDRSTFHLHFGRNTLDGLTPAQIRSLSKPQIKSYWDGMLARGVDMMAYTSGLTSGAHTSDLIDETLDAFRGILSDMIRDGVLT